MSHGMSATDEADKIALQREETARGHSVSERQQGGEMKLSAVLQRVETKTPAMAGADLDVRQVTCDSRKVKAGALFVAIPGVATDGVLFAREAAARGAVAILSALVAPADRGGAAAWIQVAEPRKALAIAAANFFGRPAEALQLV